MKTADDYDDLLQEISIVMYFIEDTIECIDKYYELYNIFENHLDIINKAPSFFGQTLKSFRFKIVVSSLRFFDNDIGSSGFERILNRAEQNKEYQLIVKDEVDSGRNLLQEIHPIIKTLRIDRDKYYAHIDKKIIFHPNDFSYETIEFTELKKILILIWNVLNEIMVKCGAMPADILSERRDFTKFILETKK